MLLIVGFVVAIVAVAVLINWTERRDARQALAETQMQMSDNVRPPR